MSWSIVSMSTPLFVYSIVSTSNSSSEAILHKCEISTNGSSSLDIVE